jgi:hypothetical protein
MRMNQWCRRILGVLFIAGGGGGLFALMHAMAAPEAPGIFFFLITTIFDAAAVIVGVLVIEGQRRAVIPGMVLLLVQIIALYTPFLTVNVMVGAGIWVVFGSGGLMINALVGANADLALLNGANWSVGLNIFALALFILIGRVEGSGPREEEPG